MADSIFKTWKDAIDAKNDADFKEGVLQNIRALKDEVYNLKVDAFATTVVSYSQHPRLSSVT